MWREDIHSYTFPLTFTECDACAAKPGAPTLCHGCLINRKNALLVSNRLEAMRRFVEAMAKQFPPTVGNALMRSEEIDRLWSEARKPRALRYSARCPVCQREHIYSLLDRVECPCGARMLWDEIGDCPTSEWTIPTEHEQVP